jgi:hypothetical protein
VTIETELTAEGNDAMAEGGRETAKEIAVAGVGAGMGGAGGATAGVLEVAAVQGTVTGLSAGVVIRVGAVAGALTFLAGYKVYRYFKKAKN